MLIGKVTEVRWAAAATALFVAGLVAQLLDAPSLPFYLACYAAGGWAPGWAGLKALRARRLDVDLLMVVAAIGAASIGQVLDGALLIVIFATSGALEAVATRKTEDSVRRLLDLAPERANRVTAAGEETVDTARLEPGDMIVVRPGERIGADGEVAEGASEVDQATITGESLPIDKLPGDEVFAGTLNGTGALRVRVRRAASDSVVARIVALVEQASATKSRTQLFVEKVEQRYSAGMVVATVALFVIPLAFGAALEPTLLRAMTFMIVASPCAVVLATMPPLLSAIANAGRHGVLVKSAVVMERLGAVERVAFDKTGTLTEGRPRLVAGADDDEVLRLAASAEDPSEHPLARAIVAAARERGLPLSHAEQFVSIPGRGISAVVDGHLVEAGRATGAEVLISIDGRPAATFAFTDRLRPRTPAVVAALTALTVRPPLLLTGDNAAAAERVAAASGLHDVRAGLLPEEKVEHVRREAGLLFVGDGVNDAPALAAAHTGVAMGRAGADLSMATADAVIVRDDLGTLPAVIALSRRARHLVVANLIIAGSFIAVLVAWDLFGDLPLPLGVAGHEGSTVIVGLNGLRLLRERAWTSQQGAQPPGEPLGVGQVGERVVGSRP
ncbi:cadmium family heavy metal-translocating P-type ATPase [Paractinoplanes lichenicola]|uniref:cadmium family heavy metal-translocating P-type ATPase n=1 Tax=Paractinoplanes lichenicola TaxID=2802976 RepID=UPI0027DBE55C|nr:cadmium family heavy metal-translocating P-type ATPase [Actinoplanes lichenicola]